MRTPAVLHYNGEMASALRGQFAAEGFAVAQGLFSPEEVAFFCNHYMEMRKTEQPHDDTRPDITAADPLRRYPRLMHPHRHDETSLKWLLDPRLDAAFIDLLGDSPIAVQTMLYFKPAGARGQALHQDNFYLRAAPGTCVAAWMALDDCDEENGCMVVVPGSHQLPVLCSVEADLAQSFTDVTVPVPADMAPVNVEMKAGDVLFFNGSLIHGSFPNRSSSRFRRALIGHYVEGKATHVGQWYKPCYRMDGTEIQLKDADSPATCGEWVDLEQAALGIRKVDALANDTVQRRAH